MRNAIILHGTGCSPKSFWLPSIKSFLEKKDYNVWVPQLPDTDKPELKKQLPFVLTGGVFREDTILIGHSAGGPLVLSVLENINIKVYKAIIISGFITQSRKEQPLPILQKKYNAAKIKSRVRDLIFINSDNDPWGCNDKQGLKMWKKFGGTLILREGEGHCGSKTFNQPYARFPLLEKLLELPFSRGVIDGSDSA